MVRRNKEDSRIGKNNQGKFLPYRTDYSIPPLILSLLETVDFWCCKSSKIPFEGRTLLKNLISMDVIIWRKGHELGQRTSSVDHTEKR